jgi:CheY-like chemotaxis protein
VRDRFLILLAEDNRADVFVVRKSLQDHGIPHELAVVADGEQAFRFIESVEAGSARPSLVLLDLNLPRRTGREVLERLRSSPACSAIPTVILTSSDAPADRAFSAELGVTMYFRKPFELEEFLHLGELIRQILRERNPQVDAE